jgi:hypothetical protein
MPTDTRTSSPKFKMNREKSTSDGLTVGPLHSRESCEGENAFFGSEDRNKKYFLRGEQSALDVQAAARKQGSSPKRSFSEASRRPHPSTRLG